MSKYYIKKYILISLAMAILSFGMFNIHSRCPISEGGVLGTALLIYRWFNVSPGISSLFLDGSLFLLGFFILGKSFLHDSIYASISYSIWYRIHEMIGHTFPNLSSNPMMAAIIGAVFVGVGVGICVSYGIAAGGDDSLALCLNKVFNIKVSQVYFISDVLILTLSLSYIPFRYIAYSMLSVCLSSMIIEIFHQKVHFL